MKVPFNEEPLVISWVVLVVVHKELFYLEWLGVLVRLGAGFDQACRLFFLVTRLASWNEVHLL
jgi:hypothetical protein